MKSRVYQFLFVSKRTGDFSWWVDIFLLALILLNVIAIVLESVEPILTEYRDTFNAFELFSVIVFTIEYVLRVWTANEMPEYKARIAGNLSYALTPMAIIDLLAILPFYLPFFGIDLRFLRILRLFRLFRIFKIARYITALGLIINVVREKREELFIAIIFTLFLLLITSTLMYHVENGAQPEKFRSIPETMWWGIATLTTVGYGDVYPITPIGKLLGGLIAVLGIGLFALPTGILASGFSARLGADKKQKTLCPNCGKEIET